MTSSMQFLMDMINLRYMPVDMFIEQHDHINYCEALIRQDGWIANIITSHQNCMIKTCMDEMNMTYEEFAEHTYPVQTFYYEFLFKKTELVAVWYHGFSSAEKVTDQQKYTMARLVESKCCDKTAELSYVNTKGLERFDYDFEK